MSSFSDHQHLTLRDYLSLVRFSPAYGVFYGVVVIMSMLLLMLSVMWPAPHPFWFITLEGLLTLLFFAEILLQVLVQRMNYFRGHWLNRVEFVLCITSVIAYIEVLVHFHVQTSEWVDVLLIMLRYLARGGRLLFFIRQRSFWQLRNNGNQLSLDPEPLSLLGEDGMTTKRDDKISPSSLFKEDLLSLATPDTSLRGSMGASGIATTTAANAISSSQGDSTAAVRCSTTTSSSSGSVATCYSRTSTQASSRSVPVTSNASLGGMPFLLPHPAGNGVPAAASSTLSLSPGTAVLTHKNGTMYPPQATSSSVTSQSYLGKKDSVFLYSENTSRTTEENTKGLRAIVEEYYNHTQKQPPPAVVRGSKPPTSPITVFQTTPNGTTTRVSGGGDYAAELFSALDQVASVTSDESSSLHLV